MSDRTRRADAECDYLVAVRSGASDGLRPVFGNGMVPSGQKQLFLHHRRVCRFRHVVSGFESYADELGHPKKPTFPLLALLPVAVSRNHDYRGVPHPDFLL